MNANLVMRVKNSLNKEYYTMNDSWLSDCIEYYLNDHQNPTQEEIIQFVMNQWVLYDLKEINNEKGCLPKNLSSQKCITLPGRYILQMNKIYDISQSKYKQLEKIRNVSVENVEATEHENAEEKFTQAWEPKSKRMLQLFLTDGVQDILAIEYKPIKFLKDDLYPGYKLMIKGPVICRKGVILLEDKNISEIGGEVDSLLIVNAVENVFARALNFEENPDPYNDNKKQKKNTESSQKTLQVEEDFDMDSEMIDQIEKQIQSQNINKTKNAHIPTVKNEARSQSNNQEQTTFAYDRSKKQPTNFENTSSKTGKSNYNNQKKSIDFQDDEDDSFLEMVDEKALGAAIVSKPSTSKINTNKVAAQTIERDDNFPTESEMYDLVEDHSLFFSKTKPQKEETKTKTSSFSVFNQQKKPDNETLSNKNSIKKDQDVEFNYDPSPPSSNKGKLQNKVSTSGFQEFPDDDFVFDDLDMKTDDFKDYFNENKKTQASKSSLVSSKKSLKEESLYQVSENKNLVNSSNETKYSNNSIGDWNDDIDFGKKSSESKFSVQYQKTSNSEKLSFGKNSQTSRTSEKTCSTNKSTESTGVKRLADITSPTTSAPQKVRCLESTPRSDKTNSRKITDFLTKPELLAEDEPNICELICDVLKRTEDEIHAVIRGKVVNVVKLTMMKTENGPIFHLEGTITDNTAYLDVVFSSEVLEKIIGYSTQEFSRKRKQAKIDPSIKDQLRDDLSKAQQTLRIMDALMEIKLKKNEKAMIMKTVALSKENRKRLDKRIQGRT